MLEPIIQASRNLHEAKQFQGEWVKRRIGLYHTAPALLEAVELSPKAIVLLDTLILNETAEGLLSKLAVLRPVYSILILSRALEASSILQLYALGAFRIGCINDLAQHPEWLNPADEFIQDLVFPPFLLSHSIEAQDEGEKNCLNLIFLGSQAMNSFANAAIQLEKIPNLSLAVHAPISQWVREKLISELESKAIWKTNQESKAKTCKQIRFFDKLDDIEKEIPKPRIFIAHGTLNEEEIKALSQSSSADTIYHASCEGYALMQGNKLEPSITSSKFWMKLAQKS